MAKKKLIEVALPLDKINAESSREKSIRQAHPSTLHLWWARRPLAATRAIIWGSLVDDPSAHPEKFPTEKEQGAERQRLFRILENLVEWENTNNEDVLNAARKEILLSTDECPPKLLDPFAGGGAIPLEAQRLGLHSEAHDLNPVAVMINKAMLEIPQDFQKAAPINPGTPNTFAESWDGFSGLAEDVRYYGEWIKMEAYKRIGHLYPKVKIPREQGGGEATAIAWIWNRTVKCPNPACGCEMPLIKTFELTKKKKYACYAEPVIDGKNITYIIKKGKTPRKGTVGRKGASCLVCNSPVELDYIRDCGIAGKIGYQLMAVVAEGKRNRYYLAPDCYEGTEAVQLPEDIPDTEIAYYPGCTNCRIYGMENFSDLHTDRQLMSLVTFSDLVKEVRDQIIADMKQQNISVNYGYIKALQLYLGFGVDRLATRMTKVCLWNTTAETIEQPFGRQAIPMVWTFPEANPFCDSTGSWSSSLSWIPKVLENLATNVIPGKVLQADAMQTISAEKYIISTDPPYYSMVPYADLSDFFYVWLRKMFKNDYPEVFATMATPKSNELVAEKYRYDGDEQKAKTFFEDGMYKTFCNIYQYVRDDYPLTIYYAFKQTDSDDESENVSSSGWETMLSALMRAGFLITGTWPVHTERTSGLKTSLNALGTSVVLVCRKRDKDALQITRRNFVNILRRELRPALRELQNSNIAPVDMAQSAIGPGMRVFSQYKKVLESDGTPMTVKSALLLINEELDMYFNDQVGQIDQASRFCIELYSQSAFNEIKFGVADNLARAKGISVATMASHGILFAKFGNVHLIERNELPEKVDSNESVIWMLTQQLTRAMEKGGISACANIVYSMFGTNAESAKDLAYRLYTIADRKGWANEAYAYNNLVVAWPDIQSRAAELKAIKPEQLTLFDLGMIDKND